MTALVPQEGGFKGASTGSGTPTGGGWVRWKFEEEVFGNTGSTSPFSWTPGSMEGVLKIVLHAKGQTGNTVFTGRCIQEAVVEDDGSGDQLLESEFEGRVTNAPWGASRAVASVLFTGDAAAGTVSQFKIGIEKGVTCNESTHKEIASEGSAKGTLSISPPLDSGTSRGRAGLPDGVTPGENPCPDVFFT
jgi:hypothetical protein